MSAYDAADADNTGTDPALDLESLYYDDPAAFFAQLIEQQETGVFEARVPADERLVVTMLRYNDEEKPFGIYNAVVRHPLRLTLLYDRRSLIAARLRFEEGIRQQYMQVSVYEPIIARSLVLRRLLHAAADPPSIAQWLAGEPRFMSAHIG